jgi:hypothetical protein
MIRPNLQGPTNTEPGAVATGSRGKPTHILLEFLSSTSNPVATAPGSVFMLASGVDRILRGDPIVIGM